MGRVLTRGRLAQQSSTIRDHLGIKRFKRINMAIKEPIENDGIK